jgi:hypothetical protein
MSLPGTTGSRTGHTSDLVSGDGILCHAFLNYESTRLILLR